MARTNISRKIYLVVANLAVVLIGLGILAIGVALYLDTNLRQFDELLTYVRTLHWAVRFVVIAAGALTAVMGLCGCVGCNANRCLLVLYLVLLFASLVLNVTVVVLSVHYNDKVKNAGGELIRNELKSKYGGDTKYDNSEAFTKAIGNFQTNLPCCGWTGKDAKQNFFTSTLWYKKQGANATMFPDSCCNTAVRGKRDTKEKCIRADRSVGYLVEDDCLDILIDTNRRLVVAVLSTFILAIVLQFLCFIAAISVIRHVSAGNADGVKSKPTGFAAGEAAEERSTEADH